MNKEKMKQSLLIGALTSSFGIFVSKLLGLLYYSPLSAIAGESNMAFYSIVYTYYDLLLQISQAGIPFAIASLVAKYYAKGDYKTVLLVRKMGTSVVLGLSAATGFFLILMAGPLARQSLGISAPEADILNLKKMFYILTVAVIIVPLLSALRGYIQGLKRLDLYASSQVLEQFVRVFSIIIFAWLFVSILHFESIWAIFVAIAAASLGAFAAYAFTGILSRSDVAHVQKLAKAQENDAAKTQSEIIKEILFLGIPYVIISFLGTAGPLVNTTFFLDHMTKVNGPGVYEQAKLASGILQANIAKISNIPSVLAIGFGSGMVPYLSESLEERDNRKITRQINQILDTSIYILVPMIMVFIFFARDIYFIMYGNRNLDLGAKLFAVSNIQIFLGTIAPIFSSIMMSLKLRKDAIITLIISFIVKFITFFPLVGAFGAYGMIYSSGLYYVIQIVMYFMALRKNFGINVKGATRRFIKTLIASLIMVIPAFALRSIIPFQFDSRIIDIAIMGVLGLIMVSIYYVITVRMGLPQKIFGIKDISLRKLIARFRV
ncbi:MAG: oligosaccharide flippase family protein [Erysipelotrichaceae bacterium]|nr:oligosaccharide flippase family protein [Erysipelotrichaceae bacterium]MBQ2138390.1 oligosaccharide flippase family protein [Erysipelotrichaceae bacterium]